jgi:GT2 family glycosyltransferase
MKVSVVVLNYNGMEHLDVCLKSLANQAFKDYEIIVADNGSTDGSVDFIRENFLDVHVMEHGENLGFARGNNLAMAAAIKNGATHVALLNNDTEVDENWLGAMVSAVESSPEIGAVQSKMLLFDERNKINSGGGEVNFTGHAWPVGLFEDDVGQHKQREIELACAGSMLIKTTVFEEVGLFDEDYFIYHEDTDLSWRIRLAGYKILFVPGSVVYHKYSASFENKEKYYLLERNRQLTLLKNYSLKSLILISPAIIFSEIAVLYYSLVSGWILKKLNSYIWNLRQVRSTLRKRKEIKRIRKIPDSKIVENYKGTMEYENVSNILIDRLFNPIFSGYWGLIKRFI